MKKITALAAALVTAASMLCGTVPAFAYNDYPLDDYRYYVVGDVNTDGEVSIEDAMLILRHATETIAGLTGCLTDTSEVWEFTANVNFTGGITVEDAQLVLQYYVENSVAQNTLSWTEMLVGDLLHSEEMITDLDVIVKMMRAFTAENGFYVGVAGGSQYGEVSLMTPWWGDWDDTSMYRAYQDFIRENNIDGSLVTYDSILE